MPDAVGTKRSVIDAALLIMESFFVDISSIGIALLLSIDVNSRMTIAPYEGILSLP